MKRFVVCLLLLAALPLFGTETVTLDTRAANLLPGTKVKVEIDAEFRMYELPKRPAGATEKVLRVPITEDMIRYRSTSNNRGLWQFTLGPNATAPTPRMELRFDKNFPPRMAGLRSKLYFHLTYTLDLPARDGDPARTVNRSIETTLAVPEEGEPMTGCLRIEQVGDGLFVGVTPACDTNLFRRPSAGGK